MRRELIRLACTAALGVTGPAMAQPDCTITTLDEIRSGPGAEAQYVELRGPEGESLEGLAFVVIGRSADGGLGEVRSIIALEGLTLRPDGLLLLAFDPSPLGRPADVVADCLDLAGEAPVTYLLTTQPMIGVGHDLDADDNGILDFEEAIDVQLPWTSVLDTVALLDRPKALGGYGEVVVGPAPRLTVPAHVYRCVPSGAWVMGAATPEEGTDTPGERNRLCPCAADRNGDIRIDVDDLMIVLLTWGTEQPAGDVDGDGVVGVTDLIGVIDSWGNCNDP